MATRICRTCGEELDLETGFYNSPMSRGGKNTICKTCIYNRRLGNPKYYKVFTCGGCGNEYQRNGRCGSFTVCPECESQGRVCKRCGKFKPMAKFGTGDAHRNCSDGCYQAVVRERRWGLAPGTYEVVFAEFGDTCAICGAAESSGKVKTLHVDHCHSGGSIRGLLCRQCNCGLGNFRDNPELLTAAIKYLERVRQLSLDEAS